MDKGGGLNAYPPKVDKNDDFYYPSLIVFHILWAHEGDLYTFLYILLHFCTRTRKHFSHLNIRLIWFQEEFVLLSTAMWPHISSVGMVLDVLCPVSTNGLE